MVEHINPKTSIKLVLDAGTDSAGEMIALNKTISGFAPGLSDDAVHEVGSTLGELFKFPVASVCRVNTYALHEAA